MKDRVPTYPNRIKLTPVSGKTNVYDLERVDEATVIGTPLNKAALLKDSTASKFGLTDSAVPDDVLALVPIPIIKVTARGGILTCKDENNVVCKSEQDGNEWTFYAPHFGSYVISGTYGTFSQSITLNVDTTKIYTSQLTYYSDVFDDNSWDLIIQACQENAVPDTWTVGSVKYLGTNHAHPVIIIGKNHDDYSDGSGKAPLTLFIKEQTGYNPRRVNTTDTNTGGFPASELKSKFDEYILQTFGGSGSLWAEFNRLYSNIKSVNKICATNSTEKTSINMKFFPCSVTEYLGVPPDDIFYPTEGERYAYFAAGNAMGFSSWSRTPDFSDSTNFFAFASLENVPSSAYTTKTKYLNASFCF